MKISKKNYAYMVFHANLAFSSIDESTVPDVIDRTYYPLFDLLRDVTDIKIGLELSGYTLLLIEKYRPNWITLFKGWILKGRMELIGSGYMQIIGPLVPYEVNIQNQKQGLLIYKRLLDIEPCIVYVNEQTLSASIVDLYVECGFTAIMMEWNNAFSNNINNWNESYSYQPVLMKGLISTIPVIWTDTILFQQFQRVVHCEQQIDDYFLFFNNYVSHGNKYICIYSSDLEVFNFRPGRFDSEAVIKVNEWNRIAELMLQLNKFVNFCLPSQALHYGLDNSITVMPFNSNQPILVKKQDKYSLSRWSACGRDANLINTLCHRMLNSFRVCLETQNWVTLLTYWGSDFRTHTTENKWLSAMTTLRCIGDSNFSKSFKSNDIKFKFIPIKQVDNMLYFNYQGIEIAFLLDKGLALDYCVINGLKQPYGTIHHGEFSHISYVADFYTGVCIIESAEFKKITDLSTVDNFELNQVSELIWSVSGYIKLKDIGFVEKVWTINLENWSITLNIKVNLNRFIVGSIRLGTLTCSLPYSTERNSWYECHNGGLNPERYLLNVPIDHYRAKSLLQSSSSGLGVTEGIIRFGVGVSDLFLLRLDHNVSVPFVMMQHYFEKHKSLVRLFFSVQELDDTLKPIEEKINGERIYHLVWSIQL